VPLQKTITIFLSFSLFKDFSLKTILENFTHKHQPWEMGLRKGSQLNLLGSMIIHRYWKFFRKCKLVGYFERLRGYDDEVAMEFSLNFQNIQEQEYVVHNKGMIIRINEAIHQQRYLVFPWVSLGIKRRDKKPSMPKRTFFLPNEKPHEDKNGIKREIFLILGQKWPIT
jgi:hypothetical protein